MSRPSHRLWLLLVLAGVLAHEACALDPPLWTEHPITGAKTPAYRMVLVDLNGDGKLDLARTDASFLSSIWSQRSGNGGSLGSFEGSYDFIFADLDQDGDLDRLGSRAQNAWFENNGTGTFTEHPGFGIGLEWAGHIDGDGLVDLVFVGPTEVTWRRNTGQLTFAEPALLLDGIDGTSWAGRLIAADFNQDGRTDFLAELAGDGLGVFVQAADGSYSQRSILPALTTIYRGLNVRDFDGDADPDIVGQNVRLINDGTGVFVAASTGGPSGSAADFDGDGRLDIANPNSTFWVRQQADGSFVGEEVTYRSTGGSGGVTTGDMDGDGDIDIVSNMGTYSQLFWYENPLITPAQTTIATWRQQHFGSPDNVGVGADDRDPDGDSVPNLLEYTFGLDPNDATGGNGSAGLPAFRRDPDGIPSFQFALPVPAVHDLTISIEFVAATMLLGSADHWTNVTTRTGDGAWIDSPLVPSFVGVLSGGSIANGRQNLSLSGAVVAGDALWRIRVQRLP